MNAELDASGFPAYAHVPGKNKRHDDALFDAICASVMSDMSVSDLSQTRAWHVGRDLYAHEYFWEAHEVLEAVWMQCPQKSIERFFVQSIIQLANAKLKMKMDRPKAAVKLFVRASQLFREARMGSNQFILGVPVTFIAAELRKLEQKI